MSKNEQLIKDYKWLSRFSRGSQSALVDDGLKHRIDYVNTRINLQERDLAQLQSGRDDVSKLTDIDIIKYTSKQTRELVSTLFSDSKSQQYMLRWVIRGLGIYPAFCKTIVTTKYYQLK